MFENYEFTRKDVEDLAQSLASAKMSDRERALLLAVFLAARDHVVHIPAKPSGPGVTGTDLKQQIIDAFVPGEEETEANLLLQPFVTGRISPSSIKPPPHQVGS